MTVPIRITEDTHGRLKKQAKKHGQKLGWLADKMITIALEDIETADTNLDNPTIHNLTPVNLVP